MSRHKAFLFLLFPLLIISLLFFTPHLYAAAPDGSGPWADNVVSSSQGMMKNGLAVPAARSDASAALGVAEGDSTIDSHFFSLGFGGNIVLGFDNGISSGILVVESTNPNYSLEKAKAEVSENGTTWTEAGTVVQDGTVSIPAGITCTKFVRITDISNPAIMPDDIADGYDVDGVQAIGEACTSTPPPGPPAPPPPGPPGPPPPPSAPECNDPKPATTVLRSANKTSSTTARLNWDKISGANSYSISYGPSSDNYQFGVPSTGDTDSFTIGDLNPNTNYCFRVRAIKGCNSSDPSNEICLSGSGGVLGIQAKRGEVLGVSTLAPTGGFTSDLGIINQNLGIILAATGAAYYAKKKKTN